MLFADLLNLSMHNDRLMSMYDDRGMSQSLAREKI